MLTENEETQLKDIEAAIEKYTRPDTHAKISRTHTALALKSRYKNTRIAGQKPDSNWTKSFWVDYAIRYELDLLRRQRMALINKKKGYTV